MNKLITVALPIIKTEFLHDAISSVLNQTFKDFEFVIYNNAINSKKDEILKIVCEFDDERIKYFENNNHKSIIEDWNLCIQKATGKYFVLFSDDDTYDSNFLEEIIFLIKKYSRINLFHSKIRKINPDSKVILEGPKLPEYESGIEFIWKRLINDRPQFAPDFICKTEKLRSIGGFFNLPLAWGSDDITWFLLAAEYGVASTNKTNCNWRVSTYNISSTGNVEDRIQAVNQYKKWLLNYLKNVSPTNNQDMIYINQISNKIDKIFSDKKIYLLIHNSKRVNLFRFAIDTIMFRKKYNLDNMVLVKLIFIKAKMIFNSLISKHFIL